MFGGGMLLKRNNTVQEFPSIIFYLFFFLPSAILTGLINRYRISPIGPYTEFPARQEYSPLAKAKD